MTFNISKKRVKVAFFTQKHKYIPYLTFCKIMPTFTSLNILEVTRQNDTDLSFLTNKYLADLQRLPYGLAQCVTCFSNWLFCGRQQKTHELAEFMRQCSVVAVFECKLCAYVYSRANGVLIEAFSSWPPLLRCISLILQWLWKKCLVP